MTYRRILVPLDGSEPARAGLTEAIALAAGLKAELVLLHVLDRYPLLVEMTSAATVAEMERNLQSFGQHLLHEAQSQVQAAGVACSTVLRDISEGRIADTVAAEARAQRCDLIVMGTHGRRGFDRLALGSDAELVVRASEVPVLLVRRPRNALHGG